MSRDVVQMVFHRHNKVLLGFRQNTTALDQLWGFPSGRIEPGETPLEGAVRESREEVAVAPITPHLIATLSDPLMNKQHYVYLCNIWHGEIRNCEPHLCREVCWFDLDSLPENCTSITYEALPLIKAYLSISNV
jgi:8-oxo-dGTP diphosphatase